MPTDEEIRDRAHQLWTEAGKPAGQDDAFWHEAEQQLLDEEMDRAAKPDSAPAADDKPPDAT